MEIVAFCSDYNNNQKLIDASLFYFQKLIEQGKKAVYIRLDFLSKIDLLRGNGVVFCKPGESKDLTQYMLKLDDLPIRDFLIGNSEEGYFLLPYFSLENIKTIFSLVSMEPRTAIIMDKIENILKQLSELSFDAVILALPAGYNAFLSILENKHNMGINDRTFLSQIRLEFVV